MPIFDSGTATFFHQSSAPTGWTKDTTNFNDHAIRVVSGIASSGGVVDFTTAFTTTPFTNLIVPMGSFGPTTLGVPALTVHDHTAGSPTTQFVAGQGPTVLSAPTGGAQVCPQPLGQIANSQTTPSSWDTGAHNHPVFVTVNGNYGDLRIKYIDVIRCTKN